MAKAPLSLQKVHSEKLSGENVYSKHKNRWKHKVGKFVPSQT
jgi:hypothetical protein